MCKYTNAQIKFPKTAGKFRDRAISKSGRGSTDEMLGRKPAKERGRVEERNKTRAVQEGERNGTVRAVVGETFVLEGKDYVCE